ncbi:MAG: hypothetical protein CMM00_05430 [Rhodopirellula sp.]|nr:hypothetical protein [Rhodopirellula sp.]
MRPTELNVANCEATAAFLSARIRHRFDPIWSRRQVLQFSMKHGETQFAIAPRDRHASLMTTAPGAWLWKR